MHRVLFYFYTGKIFILLNKANITPTIVRQSVRTWQFGRSLATMEHWCWKNLRLTGILWHNNAPRSQSFGQIVHCCTKKLHWAAMFPHSNELLANVVRRCCAPLGHHVRQQRTFAHRVCMKYTVREHCNSVRPAAIIVSALIGELYTYSVNV